MEIHPVDPLEPISEESTDVENSSEEEQEKQRAVEGHAHAQGPEEAQGHGRDRLSSLPVEILKQEIGTHLDLVSMISMSLVNKDFQAIYQSQFQKIVKEMDPYMNQGTVYDFLRITKVGTLEAVVYRVWKNIFDSMIKEIEYVYPVFKRKDIMDLFVKVIPERDILSLKGLIRENILKYDWFLLFQGVLYKNPFSLKPFCFSESFESEIIDMIDGMLHELSYYEKNLSRENSLESLSPNSTEEDSLSEYFPYENIMESAEMFLSYL